MCDYGAYEWLLRFAGFESGWGNVIIFIFNKFMVSGAALSGWVGFAEKFIDFTCWARANIAWRLSIIAWIGVNYSLTSSAAANEA